MAHGGTPAAGEGSAGDAVTGSKGENRVSQLNELFKEIYADNLENLLPKGLKLQKDIAWIEKSKSPGAKYNQPVLMRHEHGFTYANSNSGAFPLAAAVPGQTASCSILGTQMMLRSVIDYEIAARASSAGKRTFRRALDLVVENMFASSRKRMEIDYFYGQRPLAEIDAVVGDVVTVSDRSWAPGIWAGMEGSKLDFFNDGSDTAGGDSAETRLDNVQSFPDITDTILEADLSGVNVQDKALTIGTDHSATLVALGGTSRSDWITFRGAWGTGVGTGRTPVHINGNVFAGMEAVMDRAVAGHTETFELDFTGNSLWQGNVVDASSAAGALDASAATGGRLSFDLLANQIATASAKGLDENLILYLNPHIWTDLILQEVDTATASNRSQQRTGADAKSGYDIGGTSVRYHTANGVVEIKPSNYVKQGFGFMFAPKLWKRIGATDLTFRLPDRGDEFFLHLPEHAGYELRNYVSHALFTKAPAKSILIKNLKVAS